MQNRIMRRRWPWNRLRSCAACAIIRAPHGTRDSRGERSRRRFVVPIHLSTSLPLERCPHCAIVQPQLARVTERENNRRGIHRRWGVYECLVCGGLVIAAARAGDPLHVITECYPGAPDEPSDTIPARAREYLRQAR